MRIEKMLNDETPSAPPPRLPHIPAPPGPVKLGRGNWSKAKREAAAAANARYVKQSQSQGVDSASPAASAAPSTAPPQPTATGPHGFYLPLNGTDPVHKRTRPLTAHQIAVEKYRKERVDYILDRQLRSKHRDAKKRRLREGAFARAWREAQSLPDGFDSEEELHVALMQRQEGLPNPLPYSGFVGFRLSEGLLAGEEAEDDGEQAHAYLAAFRKIQRRLVERWEHGLQPV